MTIWAEETIKPVRPVGLWAQLSEMVGFVIWLFTGHVASRIAGPS